MEYITLDILQWQKDPTIYRLNQRGTNLFEDAPYFLYEWQRAASLRTFSPLYRPIPNGYDLYLAKVQEFFPYKTTEIVLEKHLFDPKGKGTYFLANKDQLNFLKDFFPINK